MTVRIPVEAPEAECRCAWNGRDECPRHGALPDIELEAADVLYRAGLDVGRGWIGGFAPGQAEETIAVLRRAGFLLVRWEEDRDA